MLKIGDKMPQFQVQDQDGKMVSSKDLLGKKTIIYFYPKDNTSGCTAEACSLRDNHEALIAKGYNVVGVSKDSAASHKKFIDIENCYVAQLKEDVRKDGDGNPPQDLHLRRKRNPHGNHREGGHEESCSADSEMRNRCDAYIAASHLFYIREIIC